MQTLLTWIYGNVDQLVAASNFTISVMMFILGTTVLYYTNKLWKTIQTDLAWIMLGVAAEAYGWMIHRTYWGLWRLARLNEDPTMDKWFIDNAYLSVIPSLMVVVGMVLILAPVCSMFFDTYANRMRHFLIVGFASFALFWFIFFQLGSFHGPESSARITYEPATEVNTVSIPPRKLSLYSF